MAYLEAGEGNDHAMAIVAPRTELIYAEREPTKTSKPFYKSKRFCCIVLLVLVIAAIVIAVAVGVAVHESNKY